MSEPSTPPPTENPDPEIEKAKAAEAAKARADAEARAAEVEKESFCHLQQMVTDAQMLAAYVSRYDIQCEKREEAIATVMCAQNWLKADELVGDKAAAFFGANARMAGAIRPATVASLRDSLDDRTGKKVKPSPARKACKRWSVGGIVVLIGLVVMHTYWLTGRSLLDMRIVPGTPPDAAAEPAGQPGIEIPTQANAPELPGPPTTPEEEAAQNAARNAAGQTSPTPDRTADAVRAMREQTAALRAIQEGKQQIAAGDYGLDQKKLREARLQLLVQWSDFTSWAREMVPGFADPKNGGSAGLPGKNSSERQKLPDQKDWDTVLLGAITKLDVLYYDWLPLVYGLLGAMAFLLRSLARSARDRTYRIEDTVANFAHLCLGAFAGLAIGWFWKGDSSGSDAPVLSPFAVAFVAGYSIDLVFSLIDRAVSNFSTRPEKTEPQKP